MHYFPPNYTYRNHVVKNKLYSHLFIFAKTRPRFFISSGVLLVIGLSLISYSLTKTPPNNQTIPKTPLSTAIPLPVSLSLAEGIVQISENNNGTWNSGSAGQSLKLGSALKTTESSAILSFNQKAWLVVDRYSMIILKKFDSSEVQIEQFYGKTYSVIDPTEKISYSISKDRAKISALGTEFLVETSTSHQDLVVSVYKNRVRFEHENTSQDIAVGSKMSYNLDSKQISTQEMSNIEKESNTGLLALLEKAATTPQPSQTLITNTASTPSPVLPSALTPTALVTSTPNTGVNKNNNPNNQAKTATATPTINTPTPTSTSTVSPGVTGPTHTPSPSNQTPFIPETTPAPTNTQTIFGQYSTASIESIVNSLPLVYNDTTNDFETPPGGAPPSGVYDYSPIDLDDLYLGVHNGRLYTKWTLNGPIATSQPHIDGDTVRSVTYNIGFDTNNNTSDNCGGSETSLQIVIEYHDNGQIWYNPNYRAGCLSGHGEHDAVYTATGRGLAHTYNSGLGKSTIVFSFALSDLANTIAAGDTVKLDIYSEAESSNWHHYSFDSNYSTNTNPIWKSWTVTEI